MKSSKRSQNFYRLKLGFADYFSSNRSCIILLSGVFVIGFAIGIFTYIKLKTTLNLTIDSSVAKSFIAKDSVFISFFLWRFIANLACIGLIFLFSLKRFSHFLVWVLLAYKGYLLGSAIVTVFMFLGIGVLIGLFLIFLPLEICISFLIVNFSCFCNGECCSSRKFGRRAGEFKQYLDVIIFFILILLVCHLVEYWFVPSMIKKIIIFT